DHLPARRPHTAFTVCSPMSNARDNTALGKPIDAFDLPDHRVKAQEAALYATPNDEAAFARALAELMDDPERRRVMGAFGRQRAESALAWPYSVPHLLNAYGRLCPDRAPVRSTATSSTRAVSASRWRQWAWWRRERSVGYIARRATALAKRYGVTPPKAQQRILACVRHLAGH